MAQQDLTALLAQSFSSQAAAQQVGIDGGLNLKTEPQRLASPAVTRADNVWNVSVSNVQQLPALSSIVPSLNTPFLHLYNIATRDLSPPAPTGDLLLLAEYPDTVTGGGFTRSLWSWNSGQTINYVQGTLPFSLRMRPFASNLGVSNTGSATNLSTPALYGNQIVFARDEASTTTRRYLAGSIQNFAFAGASGYCDGLTQNVRFSLGSNVVACDALGLQNSSYAAVLVVGSSSTNLYLMSFNAATSVTSVPIATGPANYNAPNAQLFNHAGRTYLGYTGPASTYAPQIMDVYTNAISTPANNPTASSVPTNFAVGSPYTHQTQTDTTYFAMVYNGKLYVIARSTSGTFAVVTTGVTLPVPATIPAGTYNFAATVAVNITDNQGGIGPGATHAITVFGHYPEQLSASLIGNSSYNIAMQSIYCANYIFTAASSAPATTNGTLVATGSTVVFRTPAGVGLVSKAFTVNPAEARYAGPTAAKQAVVCVQSGATEPELDSGYQGSGTPYARLNGRDSTPTYFLINHAGDIVGRFLEFGACTRPATFIGHGTNASPASPAQFPQVASLANPLFSDGTGDDSSVLSISVPVWGNIQLKTAQILSSSIGVPYQNRLVVNYTYQPVAATLALNASASAPPTVNVGPHTYISGPVMQVHDGNGVVEQNYHFGGHNMVIAPSYTGTATQPVSLNYYVNYYFIYVWYDGQGRLHRSTPSLASVVQVQNGVTLNSVTCYVPCPNSVKDLNGQGIVAEIYKTINNATDGNAYLIGTVAVPSIGKGTTAGPNYVSFTDGLATYYGSLSAQPALYTATVSSTSTGYTYAATPPRCLFWQVAGKGRCFGLAQVAGAHRLYYSSVASDILPFEWNPYNYAPVPPDIGDARSLEVMDDKVIVLGTRGNAVMNGDGPASSGTTNAPNPGDGFSPVTPIPTPAGVVGTGSPARTPDGVVFQGYSGVQLIGRDLTVSPIGAPVDVLTGRQVNNVGTVYGRAVTLPTLQSVVWVNPRGPALVYSYLTQKFSTWPLLPNAALLTQKLNGSVYAAIQPIVGTQLTPYGVGTPGADLGVLGSTYAPISGTSTAPGIVLETPWIMIGSQIGGEGDLWDMVLVGTWLGPHTLQVEQAYDYGAYVLTQSISMALQPTAYRTRWRPLTNSRVAAVRYRITLLPITTLNAGYPMANLADLVVYSKPQVGTYRTPQGLNT